MRVVWGAFFSILLFSAQVQAQEGAHLRFSTRQTTVAQRDALRKAYADAYLRTKTCEYLDRTYPELKQVALTRYEDTTPRFVSLAIDPENRYECAYTRSILNTIYLRPGSFNEDCFSLESTVFHEMLHMATPTSQRLVDLFRGGDAEEDRITVTEHRCFPEFFTYRRGLNP